MNPDRIQIMAEDIMRNLQMVLARTQTYSDQLKVLEALSLMIQNEIRITKELFDGREVTDP